MNSDLEPATAEQVIDALEIEDWPLGNKAPWGVDGVYISGTSSYVNSIDTHVDGDYRQWYLIEVCDHDDDAPVHFINGRTVPSTSGETWRQYLAVLQQSGKYEYRWHTIRHRFFDLAACPTYDVRVWFLHFVETTELGATKRTWRDERGVAGATGSAPDF